MTNKENDILSHIEGLLDDLWVVTSNTNILKMDYFDGEWAGEETITLTAGTYTTAELETHLEGLIDAAFVACNESGVSYSTITNKWVFRADEGDKIKYIDTGSTAGDLFGFTADQDGATITADTETYYYFPFVGYFPDDIEKIGTRYPALLIGDEGQEFTATSGARVFYDWTVPIYIYSNWRSGSTRLAALNVYQNIVITEVLEDLSLGSNCTNIEPISVEKGGYNPNDEDRATAGYYQNITVRKINFNIQVYDER